MAAPYSSCLLNELHTQFPDLLYRPSRFQNVQDVLQYIIDVASRNVYQDSRRAFLRTQENPPLNPIRAPNTASSNFSTSSPVTIGATSATSSSTAGVSVPAVPSVRQSSFDELYTYNTAYDGSIYNVAPRNSSTVSSLFSVMPSTRTTTIPLTTNPDNILRDILNELFSTENSTSLSLSTFLNDTVPISPTSTHIQHATSEYSSLQRLDDNCAICQDPIEARQTIRKINHCSHAFHKECIDTWFQNHATCPTCRYDIRE